MIQTAHPAHPFYRLLLRDDIDGCWQMLLDERKRATLPPFSHWRYYAQVRQARNRFMIF